MPLADCREGAQSATEGHFFFLEVQMPCLGLGSAPHTVACLGLRQLTISPQ